MRLNQNFSIISYISKQNMSDFKFRVQIAFISQNGLHRLYGIGFKTADR